MAGLVSQRASLLTTLSQADRAAGAIAARDAFAALLPILDLQSAVLHATSTRVSAGLRTPLPAPLVYRSAGPGLLLGPHLPLPTAAPFVAAPGTAAARGRAVLDATSLSLVSAPTSAVLTTRGASAFLAPAASAADPAAGQPLYADLGTAQDLMPPHALEINGSALGLPAVAPQARPGAEPPARSPAPVAQMPAVHGLALLHSATVAALGARAGLAGIAIPALLPSGGLDPGARLTTIAQVQPLLGHYKVSAALATKGHLSVPSVLASQVTWSMSATTPLSATGSLELDADGHADGGTLHDLSLRGTMLPPASAGQVPSPGTRATLSLLTTGGVQVQTVTVLTDTTTITTTARIDGVGADPALENALAGENLTMTELTGVLSAGNAVYARLHPLYLTLEAQYTQQLASVMGENAAGEQAWWDRFSAWHTYQLALAKWKQRTAAWNAYLTRRAAAAATATPTQAPPRVADPIPSVGRVHSTNLGGLAPARPPGMAEPPQIAITPIFGVAATATPIGGAAATSTPVPLPSSTPSPADTAVEATPTSTATAPEPPVTATTEAGTATATVTGAASATATETAMETVTATASGTVTVPPSITAGGTTTSTPSPSPSPSPSPVPSATPTAPPEPGPAPAAVPQPGLEPAFLPLPPPIPPIPTWVDAAPSVSPPVLSSSFSQGINALGYATMSTRQLIAGGALDNIGSIAAPLQGVITTYWGGSTPFQSFHPGLDIAAPLDTPIRAAADGIVVYAGLAVPGDPTVSYGNCVLILHNNHLSTVYGHMDLGIHGLVVRPGEVVHQGQIIGYEGSTGWATGPHLHFEMRYNNVQFDPLLLISQQAITG